MSHPMTVPPALASKAQEAWERLLASYGEMPLPLSAGMALDWLMDDTTDDRSAAKGAIYRVAWATLRSLYHKHPDPEYWDYTIHLILGHIATGDFSIYIDNRLKFIIETARRQQALRHSPRYHPPRHHQLWIEWHNLCEKAVAICRAIQAA